MTEFYRDTWAEVNLDNIYENIINLRKHLSSQTKLFAVVKANAYGHGDVDVAKTALYAGADYLAVAFLDEALALRKKGILAPILVLGVTRPESVKIASEERITLTIFQDDWIQQAKSYLQGEDVLYVHVKCDSGMGRLGVRNRMELEAIEGSLLEDSRFVFEGIYTHFSTADSLNENYYHKQLGVFQEMLSWLKTKPQLIHASNSAASLRFPESTFNAVRMGIAMYGLTPSVEMKELLPFPLRPALSLKTRIVNVKELKKGESVSYGATYTAAGNEWIGTLPIGYADGWIRKLQGQEVLVNGEKAPIVGRICMDQCMIKLPENTPINTEVTLIGKDNGQEISVDEIAEQLETINYEITCMIASRIPRVYVKNGKITHVVNALL
ncbi:alanine racemase [Peribacillus loiseleuriae]|uniref:Alanine racemase n=1 Tax=Peribacillus loiseleuriae TaxID=1679170 RepID=A0A0K9H004_9BACI|nr:alanine racemase [Peribacillus loiseleuriae]KMY52170.1 alanine racemase [Peribacillus loiseleuriae]